ncbi:helix-turn-helix transcriptional regulator [Sinomonas sp.]|uniref:helix-turn-helix transcriptional regulator n=1 Tax=Sinomonas sp. TaxID=1914986 RepID=UPI003F7D596A
MKVKDPGMLRRWRRQENLSQEQLGFLVKRSQTTIHLLETGRMTRLSEDLALALAVRLKRPWNELFELEDEERLGRRTDSGARPSPPQEPGSVSAPDGSQA